MDKKKIKKIKKIKNNKNLFRKLLIIAVLVYLLVMSIPILRTSNAKTTPVKKANYVDSVNSKGVVLKDEIVYKAQTKGSVKFSVKEGTKLSKDTKIAEINNAIYDDYKRQLKDIEREIDEYNRRISAKQETLKKDIQKNQGEIDYIIKEVQKNVAEGNYEEVNTLKDRLLIISDKKDAMTNEKTLMMEQMSNAMKKKSEIVNKMKQSSLIYNAEKAGIVSKTMDGLEDKFSAKNLSKYTAQDLSVSEVKTSTTKDKQEVNMGSPIFKIIEDQKWFIMTNLENTDLGEIKEGDIVSLRVDSEKENLEGTVFKLKKTQNNTFLIIVLDKYLHELYKKRYIDINLTKKIYTGLEVPKKSIIEKDGKKGVFIKDISGVVKFREVKLLKNTKDTTIVEATGKTKPIELFDEVFIEGNKVTEGQIVNYRGGD